MVKGARKPKSRLAPVSEPLTVASIQAVNGRARRIITQAEVGLALRGIRSDYNRLLIGLAAVECATAILPYEMPDPDAWWAVMEMLCGIEAHETPWVPFLAGSMRLMETAGVLASLGACSECGREVRTERPWFDAASGGLFCEDHLPSHGGGFRCDGRALIGLARLRDITPLPARMNALRGAIQLICHMWEAAADKHLPALATAAGEASLP